MKADWEWAGMAQHQFAALVERERLLAQHERAKVQDLALSLRAQIEARQHQLAVEKARNHLEEVKSAREADAFAARQDARLAAVKEEERKAFAELQAQRKAQRAAMRQAAAAKRQEDAQVQEHFRRCMLG